MHDVFMIAYVCDSKFKVAPKGLLKLKTWTIMKEITFFFVLPE